MQENPNIFPLTYKESKEIVRVDINIRFPIKSTDPGELIADWNKEQYKYERKKKQPRNTEFRSNTKGTTFTIGERKGAIYRRIYVEADEPAEKNNKKIDTTEKIKKNKDIPEKKHIFTLECEIKKAAAKKLDHYFFYKKCDDFHMAAIKHLIKEIKKFVKVKSIELPLLFIKFAEAKIEEYRIKTTPKLMQRYDCEVDLIQKAKRKLNIIENVYKNNLVPYSPILPYLIKEKQNPAFVAFFGLYVICSTFF